MDRFTALRIFCSVIEAGSFTKAAINLSLSRPAISKNIRELEIHLGATLLNRTTRGIAVTDLGKQYYETVSDLLKRLEDADETALWEARAPRGTLRIAMPVTLGNASLVPLLPNFIRDYPDINLDISLNEEKLELLEGNFDVAVRASHQLTDSSLISRSIGTLPYVVCASPEYLASAMPLRHPSDLSQHRLLIHGFNPSVEQWSFASNGEQIDVNVRASHRSNSSQALKLLLLDGIGVAKIPNLYVADDLKAGRLVALFPRWQLKDLRIWAIYPQSEFIPRRTRLFVDFIAKNFKLS